MDANEKKTGEIKGKKRAATKQKQPVAQVIRKKKQLTL